MKLETIISKFLKNKKVHVKTGTYRFYNCHLQLILSYFNSINIDNLEEIDIEVIEDFVLWQKEKNPKITNNTLQKRLLCLKLISKYALEEKLITEDKIKDFQNFKKIKKRFNVLKVEEVKRLFKYANESLSLRNQLIIHYMFDTGIRLNEFIQLNVEDILKHDGYTLLTITKTDNDRIVPYSSKTKDLLKLYIGNRTTGPLLLNQYKGTRVTKSCLAKVFNDIKKELNFNKFHPHMLRHTFATFCLKSGADLKLIQEILGHSDIKMTETYLHYDIESLLENYNKFNPNNIFNSH